jgi:hypothetical protein
MQRYSTKYNALFGRRGRGGKERGWRENGKRKFISFLVALWKTGCNKLESGDKISPNGPTKTILLKG